MTLVAVGAQVLDAVRKAAPSVQAESYAVASESRAQEWSEGKPENQSASRSQGIGLRVIDQGKLGFSSTNRTDGEVFAWLRDGGGGVQSNSSRPFFGAS